MGSDARIYVFDHERYTTEVLPAWRRLLLHGEMEPWLQDLWLLDEPEFRCDMSRFRGTDLERDCTYLWWDLSYPHKAPAMNSWDAPWEKRACRSSTCPSRASCPYHRAAPDGIAEEAYSYFERAVVARCLGQSEFVGRSVNVTWYQEHLTTLNVDDLHWIRRYLWALGSRGFVVGYGWANGDGIHGWLSPDETRLLGEGLDQRDLPRFASVPDAVAAFRNPDLCPGYPLEALSLALTRAVAHQAQEEQKGILWGNDVWDPEAGPPYG